MDLKYTQFQHFLEFIYPDDTKSYKFMYPVFLFLELKYPV